ncbi:MAG: hypothetical protein AB7V02_08745 [Parvularculaceae bacterium]
MILRRVIAHFRKQEWTAIAIDFVIVVMGVGVALAAGEWMKTRSVKADLKAAEITIHGELYRNYLNALERIAVRDCSAIQIRQLADQIKNTDDPWEPVAPLPNGGSMAGELGSIFRAPYRGASLTSAWEAAGDAGLLIYMDPERRGALSELFSVSETLSRYQDDVFRKQSELKALMITTELSVADRLRYYDILGEIDAASALMELGAQALVSNIEALAISVEPEFEQQFLEDVESRNRQGREVYGECFEPMVLPSTKDAP